MKMSETKLGDIIRFKDGDKVITGVVIRRVLPGTKGYRPLTEIHSPRLRLEVYFHDEDRYAHPSADDLDVEVLGRGRIVIQRQKPVPVVSQVETVST